MAVSSLPRVKNRSRRAFPVIAIHALLLLVGLPIIYILVSIDQDDQFQIRLTSLAAVSLFAWSLWSWHKITGKSFDPYTIFLIIVMLFNGGHAILALFNLSERGVLDGIFPSYVTLQALFSVIISIGFLHLGALLGVRKGAKRMRRANNPHLTSLTASSAKIVGWGLFIISLPASIVVLGNALQQVLAGGYFVLFQGEAKTGLDAGPQIIATFLVPAALILLATGANSRRQRIFTLVVIVVYSLTRLFLGSRYYAMLPLISYAWLWHRCVRPLPKIVMISAVLVVLVVLPLVGATRNIKGGDRLSIQSFVEAYTSDSSPAIALLHEMGGSLSTVAYTITLVPSTHSFELGESYGYAFLTVFPNLFWDIHPTIAHGIPSIWLTWQVDPYLANIGGGVGFSLIAEAYLNFGWFGIPVILFVIGLLYGRLTSWYELSMDSINFAIAACFCNVFTLYARSEMAVLFRGIIWYCLIPWLLIIFVKSYHTGGSKSRALKLRQRGNLSNL